MKAELLNELLSDLCCPETRQGLAMAGAELVGRLNKRIERGELVNRSGRKVEDAFDAGLVREDGKALYPMRQGVPVLLVAEAIELEE